MKKKHPLLRFIIFVLIVAALYFIYDKYNVVTITAEDLAFEFTHNIENANDKYLNKEIKVTGEVKALYKLMNTRQVLELSTPNDGLPIIVFFKNKPDEYEAQKLREEDMVTVKGVCLGTSAYSYVKGIKIDVENISKE
jgi:tRNA_anti-like